MNSCASTVCATLLLIACPVFASSTQQASTSLSQRLEQVRIAELEFREAELPDVISVLVRESRINFVLLDPTGKARPITLSLRNIPLDEAIRYIAEAAGLRYRYDKHAVVFFALEEGEQLLETRAYAVESGALKTHILQPGDRGLLRRPEDF